MRDGLLPKFEFQSCFVAGEEFLVMARRTFTVQPSVKMEEKERKLYGCTYMVCYFVLTSLLFGNAFAGECFIKLSLNLPNKSHKIVIVIY